MERLEDKKLFLLDMDGTIYIDEDLFPGTIPFLDAVRERGGRYLFLTNNSSRSVDAYIGKLARMGIPSAREDFLTSVDALIADLAEAGVPVTDRLEDDIDCLLMGFDTELVFQKLEDACILLNRGVEYIAANLDWVCPTWYGSVPDVGCVCEMLFKLAVEMGIISNITAAVNDIPEDTFETLRLNVAQEVARTNGILTFEDADEWQNGGD